MGLYKSVVAHHAALRILRGQDVVIERAFVVIGVFGLGLPAKQVPGQLEHIIRVASFGSIRTKSLREPLLRGEHFAIAVPADHVRPFIDHGAPEEQRGRLQGRLAG